MKKIKRAISNNFYMLKLLHSVAPSKIYFNILMTLWGCVLRIIKRVFVIKAIITALETGQDYWMVVFIIIGVFFFNIITDFTINIYDTFYLPRIDIEINRKLLKMFYKKSSQIDISCFESPEYFDKYVRAGSAIATKANSALHFFCDIIRCVFMTFSVSFILFEIDPFLIFFGLTPLIYSIFFEGRRNKFNYKCRKQDSKIGRESDYIQRTFYLQDFAKELRLTNVFTVLHEKYNAVMEKMRDLIKKRFPAQLGFELSQRFLVQVIVGLGTQFYASFLAIVKKSIMLSDYAVVTSLVWEISVSLGYLGGVIQSFLYNALYIEDIRTFFEAEPKIGLNENGIEAPKDELILRLENVSFKYECAENYCLENINLEIKPKEKIAIVGNNGAGKTTLVKLIMRLYDTCGGKITLNGTNIKEFNLNSYRNTFSTIFQDHQSFSLTIAENILMHEKADADNDTVTNALKQAGLYEKVNNLELKDETILTREFDDKGVILSGGEYQKIALARVFAKDSGIVILDEPSSALDPLAEYKMYENMMKACENKSVIFISHRLSSAVLADKVYLIEDGIIKEQGSHRELMQKNGRYAEMFNKQAEYYIETGAEVNA
ncbi:MAG: hypothetical protein DBX47_07220 [Clostridiales bacterium]|nr:MAG: hypothetical protein DBX47_07220 [Clostridiales bacterium]